MDDHKDKQLKEDITILNKALLVFHSPTDNTVSINEASAIYSAANHPKSFVSLDKADHLLTKREDDDYLANTVGAWISRDLPHDHSSIDSRL